jgi:hypothetical protein
VSLEAQLFASWEDWHAVKLESGVLGDFHFDRAVFFKPLPGAVPEPRKNGTNGSANGTNGSAAIEYHKAHWEQSKSNLRLYRHENSDPEDYRLVVSLVPKPPPAPPEPLTAAMWRDVAV